MNPLISIIVPVYKTEKYLDRCMESIINQTYTNLEIILIDDSSPDNCPAMCDAWAKKDSRIKVLHIENNGVANARNQGLKITNGEYIGFVDSDDYIELNAFEQIVALAIDTNADITVCDYQINNETQGNKSHRLITQEDALKIVATGDYKYGVLWNKLYKKSVIEGIEMPHLVCSEDLVFNYYSFKNSNIIVESDLKLYHYCQYEDSTVHKDFGAGAFDAVKAREIILNECLNNELKEYAIRGYIISCYFVLNSIIRNKKLTDSYDEYRSNILKHKKTIFSSRLFSTRMKIKTLLLLISPRIYNKLSEK